MRPSDSSTSPLHLALATYLLLCVLFELRSRIAPEPVPPDVLEAFASHHESLDTRTMNARELRRLPGIGRLRAEAVVRAREEYSGAGSLRWDDVPGIGVITRERIEAWLWERGVDPAIPLAGGTDRDPPEDG